jgi:hypothetical protein
MLTYSFSRELPEEVTDPLDELGLESVLEIARVVVVVDLLREHHLGLAPATWHIRDGVRRDEMRGEASHLPRGT